MFYSFRCGGAHVCIIRCTCLCAHLWGSEEQNRVPLITYHSPPYSLETGSLTNVGSHFFARLVFSEPHQSPCFHPS